MASVVCMGAMAGDASGEIDGAKILKGYVCKFCSVI